MSKDAHAPSPSPVPTDDGLEMAVIKSLRDSPIGEGDIESVKSRGATHRGLTHNAAKDIAKRIARALKGNSLPAPEDGVERAAKAIYELFSYDEPGVKPEWHPRGNSRKQDEARRYARAALEQSLQSTTPPAASPGQVGGDELKKALEPFASLATQYEAAWKNLTDRSPAFDADPHLLVGHFRAARAALSDASGEKK